MRRLPAIPLLFVIQALAAEHQFVSPNGEFEAYTTAANDDGTGMKLFLRHAKSPDAGVLLRQNNPGSITHEKIVARIGTQPLKLAPTE